LASALRVTSRPATIDPVLAGEWYLAAIHAFDFWPTPAPPFKPIRVAVLDSGIDGSHPDFQGAVAAERSFAGGSPLVDQIGHGTMVAGEILAAAGYRSDEQQTASPVELMIGKIVAGDGSIDVEAEARAIRWAADNGARVINLSLGARRDPHNPARDQYSQTEDAAVQYAYRKGALVVAATGNCEDVCPYRFADYPAALPHVLAVSAFAEDGATPAWSNRDNRRNDLAAPGVGIVSTYPFALTIPGCVDRGYSVCASDPDYRRGDGTSFAAPLASAAAALLIALQPTLMPNQVMSILERTADPLPGHSHSQETGYGHLDAAKALQALARPLPQANSPAGLAASTGVFRFGGSRDAVRATLDYFDDPLDVYSIHARRGDLLTATVSGPIADNIALTMLAPSMGDVRRSSRRQLTASVVAHAARASRVSLVYRARATGWYTLSVRALSPLSGDYELLVRRS
jgi:subtilisin family serine protease